MPRDTNHFEDHRRVGKALLQASDSDERLEGLPRLLRYAMMVSDSADHIERRLVAEIDEPSPMGGIGSDYFSLRHLLSSASALRRQDNNCWGNAREFLCPTKIIYADPRFGAGLLEGHEARLRRRIRKPKSSATLAPGIDRTQHARLSNASSRMLRISFQHCLGAETRDQASLSSIIRGRLMVGVAPIP